MDQYLEEEIVITEDLQAGVADIDEHGRQFSCLKFPAGSPRESHMLGSPHPCIFCSEEIKGRILMERGTVFVIEDLYPVTQGHLLIIPFRHTMDYFTMTDTERLDAQQALIALREQIKRYDSTVQGFT